MRLGTVFPTIMSSAAATHTCVSGAYLRVEEDRLSNAQGSLLARLQERAKGDGNVASLLRNVRPNYMTGPRRGGSHAAPVRPRHPRAAWSKTDHQGVNIVGL